jgi:ribonuclease BN (tRNA processing enzyme)
MELIVVGCSGSVSGPDSAASSYLVQAPHRGRTFSLLLDIGPGSLGALYRHLDPREVDAVGLSHLHPDHCLDACAFYVAAKYSPGAPWNHTEFYGPAGTAERLARAYEVPTVPGGLAERGPGIEAHFRYHDWQADQQIGPFRVRTARVNHPVEAYAIRVEADQPGGGTLVFSGDTGPSQSLVDLAAGADLLLVEAAFLEQPGNPPGLHLTGAEAAATGAAAGVGAVMLTHIPPWHDPERVLLEATPHFDGPLMLAQPDARWTIG